MERVDWSITTQYWEGSSEQFLFTYSEEEREEARLNRMNAQLVLKPKFIPLYPKLLQNGYGLMESVLLWFIDFFLWSADRFYCTNEQLAEMLSCSTQTISTAIKSLESRWDIILHKRRKAWWGTIRFITLGNQKNIISGNQKIGLWEVKNVDWIENKIIENKIIDIYNPKNNGDTSLNSLAVSEKERKVALKERKLAMAREEYNFVWEFLDRNNPITAYCYSKYPDYEGSQMEAVDKLMKQGYPLEVIKMALMYIKQDKFWSKNILSVKKLLEKNRDGIPYIVTIIQQMKDYRPVVAEL